jgi:predicted esterase
MVQIDYSLKKQFSWSEYCETSKKKIEAWEDLSESSKDFLQRLNLPSQHPNCITGNFFDSDAPLMGPLLKHDYHDSLLETITTSLIQASPTSIAMGELWFRLFAGFLSPVGIAYLVMCILSPKVHTQPPRKMTTIESKLHFRITCASFIALASSLILATDMWYIYQFGPHYGISLFAFASTLSMVLIHRYQLTKNLLILIVMWGLAFSLTYRDGSFNFGGDELPYNVSEGLYYDNKNTFIRQLVEEWPKENRTYSLDYGATPWTVTGDTRTGIPFLINDAFPLPSLNVVSMWVPTVDDEAVRLEIIFPPKSYNQSLEGKSIHVILHGLSGGSQEEYVKDYVHRATARGHTIVIMIARGLMDTPIKGWNVFHGARVDDINVTAKALRNALLPGQSLIGIGYSMGAIILANYVARSGKACSLDAAIAVSGVLDARYQYFNERAKRLWQPLLAITLRDQFVMGKLANKYQERLTRKQMVSLMRATHITVRIGLITIPDVDAHFSN